MRLAEQADTKSKKSTGVAGMKFEAFKGIGLLLLDSITISLVDSP